MVSSKRTINRICKFADRSANKLAPFDICHVYLLDFDQIKNPKRTFDEIEFRFLSKHEVFDYSKLPETDLGDQMHTYMETQNVRCFAAVKDSELLGHVWLADGIVQPEHNCGGHKFQGMGLNLQSNTVYLFKCFVLEQHRGQGLNNQLIWHLVNILRSQNKDQIVTTTHWTNAAFQKCAARLGFEKIGILIESGFASRKFFWATDVSSHGIEFFKPTESTTLDSDTP